MLWAGAARGLLSLARNHKLKMMFEVSPHPIGSYSYTSHINLVDGDSEILEEVGAIWRGSITCFAAEGKNHASHASFLLFSSLLDFWQFQQWSATIIHPNKMINYVRLPFCKRNAPSCIMKRQQRDYYGKSDSHLFSHAARRLATACMGRARTIPSSLLQTAVSNVDPGFTCRFSECPLSFASMPHRYSLSCSSLIEEVLTLARTLACKTTLARSSHPPLVLVCRLKGNRRRCPSPNDHSTGTRIVTYPPMS